MKRRKSCECLCQTPTSRRKFTGVFHMGTAAVRWESGIAVTTAPLVISVYVVPVATCSAPKSTMGNKLRSFFGKA